MSQQIGSLDEARALLAELADQVGADFAAVVLAGRAAGGTSLLAGHGSLLPSSWETDEPVSVRPRRLLAREPGMSADVFIRALRDGTEVALSSAVSTPMPLGRRRGWLIFGALAPTSLAAVVGFPTQDRLENILELERLRREHHVYQQVLEGARRLDRVLGTADAEALLHSMVVTAREILHTDAAYLAVPDADDGSSYVMAAFANVRTATLRRLRLAHDEGLGGLARQRLRPVLTPEYLTDARLKNPATDAALSEGFRSAISTPLLLDGNTIGSLYVANRSNRILREEDAEVLRLFGQHATAALATIRAHEVRTALARLRDREEFAYELHDNVVRALVEISLDAESFRLGGSHEEGLDAIGRHARATLEWLRTSLSTLARQPAPATTIAELCVALQSEHGELTRSVSHLGPDAALEPATATRLAAVAREAIRNADLHSHGTHVDVRIEVTEQDLRLTVSDDGEGLDQSRREDPRHFGLPAMQRRVDEEGGELNIGRSEAGGVKVDAVLPRLQPKPGRSHASTRG